MKSMVWLALMAVTLGAHAGEEESTPCDNVDTDQQSQACATFSRQTAERELAAAFDELVQRIRDQYPDEGDKLNDLTERLQAAEKIWTQLRDADCKVETYAEKTGTKAFEAAWNLCVAQRSDDRSEYLQSIGQQ
ncbi:hypothetical protein PS627_03606 [Pseudomonas fluorescens]|uniref:lysozyme inhibitor LprI family protein n=1 Tax=Pseudomonas fluorescens TaxID=294 RepID=UPI0012575204|nr:lysozyme inhibitor LprI family protein [Pseudomonas fluorescens]CAG8869612.1 hypothetical protein PS627_03606 [Pseudomonas fluorescens]VVP99019.1 hypothetical protein PS910_03622 [Pseudomonas fluorescens]